MQAAPGGDDMMVDMTPIYLGLKIVNELHQSRLRLIDQRIEILESEQRLLSGQRQKQIERLRDEREQLLWAGEIAVYAPMRDLEQQLRAILPDFEDRLARLEKIFE